MEKNIRILCPHCGVPGVRDGGYIFCPNCAMSLGFSKSGDPELRVHGVNADEVERVAKAPFGKLPETRAKERFPLVCATFFLIMFVVVFGGILTVAKLLPVYAFVLVVLGGIITFSVVGAFILRQDESLSEKTFLI